MHDSKGGPEAQIIPGTQLKINIMATDALVTVIARSLSAMIVGLWSGDVHVFFKN